MAAAVFYQRKKRILGDLQSDETDLSPKGKPDDEILELLELINSQDNYVSTSSCSGRAVVFLDANRNGHGDDSKGRWLMSRHAKFDEGVEKFTIEELHTTFFADFEIGAEWDSNERPSRLVVLKFEPLVHHVDLLLS